MKMNKVKLLFIGGAALLMVVLLGAQVHSLESELNEYKAVYDGLELFEDGSWTYKQEYSEYHFWNWDLKYVDNNKY